MKRPEEFSGESPLARLSAAFKTLAEFDRYIPKGDLCWLRELPLAVRSHTIGLLDPFTRHVAYPIMWAQRVLDEPGDKQANARQAIQILRRNCADETLANLCIEWLRRNHNVV